MILDVKLQYSDLSVFLSLSLGTLSEKTMNYLLMKGLAENSGEDGNVLVMI